ncbi:MAG: MBL fold metallo-hydrolase [Alphaproteobacteria bacterium]|nr:MBL fold metallo-hydrolase [Alphaproteobacteria bacterium]
MPKNNEVKFEVLHMPPQNTNSVLVSVGQDAVIFDPWGKAKDWEKVLLERGLTLRGIYATHGHPDHISAAPSLAHAFHVDWYLNSADEYLIGWGNELLDMFEIPHIHDDYQKPIHISAGAMEVLPDLQMEIMESPGHTPGGLMFYFPQYKILFTGDTLFADSVGRTDFPGGDEHQLMHSIHNLIDLELDDETYVVHGHGMETTIEWLKQHNQYFKD